MTTRRRTALVLAGAAVSSAVVAVAAQSPAAADPIAAPDPSIAFEPIGRYSTELGEDNAEIVAYSGNRMFVTNSSDNSLDVVDLDDPADPDLSARIDLAPYGGGPNSVDVYDDLVAVAVEADDKTNPGSVVFFDLDGDYVDEVTVGALPDMLTFTPDGSKVLVANEGEPSDDYKKDPNGTVSIIDVATLDVDTVGFGKFNRNRLSLIDAGLRVFGPKAPLVKDLEPEYITVAEDGTRAWVSLQENNAIAELELGDSPEIVRITPLGTKDHMMPGNGIDASDRDGLINIANWPVEGMYQPDGIAAFTVEGETYIVSANEGDARDYDGFAEESRVKDLEEDFGLPLDPSLESYLPDDQLGRLTVTTVGADSDGDGDADRLQAFGSRSFSIWNADVEQVFDSGDDLERITASVFPENFNASNDNDNFDNRSDNKGPEPEAATTAEIDGRQYAFIGLERIGGFVVYDVTDPTAPSFVQYSNTRDFIGDDPDLGPESIEFVSAADSPTGNELLLVSNEITATVVVYERTDPDGATTLSLLHNNDGESALLPLANRVDGVNVPVGGVAYFATMTDNQIGMARDLGNSVVNVYAGDAFLASATLACSFELGDPLWDAVAQRQIPFDAHILGNHEFDYSPDLLEDFIRGFEVNGLLTQPFLSSNLDFSGESGFADLVDGDDIRMAYRTDGRVVAQGAVIVDDVTGQRFGVVGATTPLLPTISSPRDVTVTEDLDATREAVQAVIDRMTDEIGVTKIIFVSHLQDLATDRAFVPTLRNVDLAVGGGGDELLSNHPSELLPGEGQDVTDDYPVEVTDGDGRTVYIVTTPGNYKYLGRLDVVFDDMGEITSVDTSESRLRRVIPENAAYADSVPADEAIVGSVTEPLSDCLDDLEATPVAVSEVDLDVSRDGVRGGGTNGGDLIADSFLDAYSRYGGGIGGADPVIAVQNGGGIRQNAGNILPNDPEERIISLLDTINVLPFDNFMALVQDITPTELKTILERSAATLVTVDPDTGVKSPGTGGQFLQIAGFEVTYDPNQPVGSRVREVVLESGTSIVTAGAVVAGAPTVDIVTNSFTAAGGDDYPVLPSKTAERLRDASGGLVSYEQAFREFLQSFPPPAVSGLPTLASGAGYDDKISDRIEILAIVP